MSQSSSPANWQQVKELFHLAVELPHDARADFLSAHCDGDDELRAAVEDLLRADDQQPTLLEHSPLAAIKESFPTDAETIAAGHIGHYRILRELGRGGMGTVYEAVRADDEFEQRVAVKLIRRGMDTEDVRRRFRNERQILANLDHPNIARLLDGGTTADGLPYFVMEYVAGVELLTFCEARNLSVNERLALFRKVCAAVSYAHTRLVVHRDLKPSNILVNEDGEPKLLDFGISKLLTPEALEQTGTATALGMMTPHYASPEQFRGGAITTATDVYALGVILFELLTGHLPYELRDRRLDEVARVVCDISPDRPSDAVITRGREETLDVVDASGAKTDERMKDRATDGRNSKTTSRSLRGDVDNIILKALRKEPERRYSSIDKFSDDIRRHLAGLPVTARPDTFSYRAEKFIKRHRASVVAAALILLTLIGGIVGTSWQAVRAERERRLAEKRFAQVRQLANNVVFKYYDEIDKLAGSTKAREMLVTDALEYLDALSQDARDNTDLQRELAVAYIRIGKVQGRAYNANLGDTSGAIASYRKGIALLEPIAVKSNDAQMQGDLAGAYSELATALGRQGNKQEADAFLRQGISLNEKFVSAHAEDLTLPVRLSASYIFLGDTLPVGKGANESIETFKHAVAVADDVLRRDPNHVRANNLVAAALDRIQSHLLTLAKNAQDDDDAALAKQLRDEAAPYSARTLELSEKLVKLQPDEVVNDRILKTAQVNAAQYLFEAGRYDEAQRGLAEAVLDFTEFSKADPDNQEQKLDLAIICSALGANEFRRGQVAPAEVSFKRSFQILDELIAHDAQNFDYLQKRLMVKYLYADEQLFKGDTEAARRAYEKAFAQIDAAAREKDAAFGESLRGYYLAKLGDCDLAVAGKTNLPMVSRRAALDSALASYQQAVELWRQHGAQSSLGVEDAGRVELLERKISRSREMLNTL